MSERTFTYMLMLQTKARAIESTIDALIILPNYEANKELIQSYQDRLEKLIDELREELK